MGRGEEDPATIEIRILRYSRGYRESVHGTELRVAAGRGGLVFPTPGQWKIEDVSKLP